MECVETNTQQVRIKIITSSPKYIPSYESLDASGADLKASLIENVVIEPGKIALIPTGIFLEIPEGFEAQIRPRSGLALRSGVTVLNSPGTIDSDYRGEVQVILINHGALSFTVTPFMRIAQMVIAPFVRATFCQADLLVETERGAGGFGHTGQ